MILWLASYPRSGNTFIRILLKEYFGLKTYSKYNDETDIGSSQDFSSIVGHEQYQGSWSTFHDAAAQSDTLVPIKTHDAPSDDAKAIYIIRDPRAVMVSLYHYLDNFGQYKFTMEDIILGATTFGSWAHHYASWDPRNRQNTLFLQYEDIVQSPDDTAAAIATFLDIDLQDATFPDFDELQISYPNFFRSGNNKRNFGELSDHQHQLLKFMYGDEMKTLGYDKGDSYDKKLVLSALRLQSEKVFDLKREAQKSILNQEQNILNQEKNMRNQEKTLGALQKINSKVDAPSGKWAEEFEQLKKIMWRVEARHAEETKKLSSQLTTQNQQIGSLDERLATAVKEIASAKAENHRLHHEKSRLGVDLDRLKTESAVKEGVIKEVSAVNEHLKTRIDELEYALEPRIKTIATLRPLRYAWASRNRLKQSGADHQSKHNAPSIKPASANAHDKPLLTPLSLVEKIRRETKERSIKKIDGSVENLGIALFTHNRAESAANLMEALSLQGALGNVHVWIDGDQGKPKKRTEVDFVHECVKQYSVKSIRRNRGNFGFRKLILLAMKEMMQQYDRILFLEDDCFPTQGAIREFSRSLDAIQDDSTVFSVYGHPFLFSGEEEGSARFQGWGWATTTEKLTPVWRELMDCYLMSEQEYLSFIGRNLTPEIEKMINITPGRQPTSTLKKFFAWDETLGLLTAMRGQRHQRTVERVIYNCGADGKSAHFSKIEHFRKPPFNMIAPDEVWNYY